jgi:hypothetical protein
MTQMAMATTMKPTTTMPMPRSMRVTARTWSRRDRGGDDRERDPRDDGGDPIPAATAGVHDADLRCVSSHQ